MNIFSSGQHESFRTRASRSCPSRSSPHGLDRTRRLLKNIRKVKKISALHLILALSFVLFAVGIWLAFAEGTPERRFFSEFNKSGGKYQLVLRHKTELPWLAIKYRNVGTNIDAVNPEIQIHKSKDEPSARHSPVAYIDGRVRRKWTPGQNPGPRPPRAGLENDRPPAPF
jgi:hypothetical protein